MFMILDIFPRLLALLMPWICFDNIIRVIATFKTKEKLATTYLY